jgi:myosin-5
LGVLDSLKVRKESFPIRKTYRDFFKIYGDISNEKPFPILEKENADFRELSIKLFKENFSNIDSLMGTTKIFMKM